MLLSNSGISKGFLWQSLQNVVQEDGPEGSRVVKFTFQPSSVLSDLAPLCFPSMVSLLSWPQAVLPPA